MNEQKRQYVRVTDTLQVAVRRIATGETAKPSMFIDRYLPAISAESRTDDELKRLIREANAKLDRLLGQRGENTGGIAVREQSVNLSAGGIRLLMDEPVACGDMAEIRVVLPNNPSEWLCVFGTVQRIEETAGGVSAALSFVRVTDEARNLLVLYTLNRQRELRREPQQ